MEKPVRQVVYVIDDEPGDRDALAAAASKGGYAQRVFSGGGEFLNALPSLRFGCVISDVRMPGVDGLALAEELREARPDFPLIMISAHADIPVAVRAMKIGARDFIMKPCVPEEVIQKIREALGGEAPLRRAINSREILKKIMKTTTPRELQVLKLLSGGHSNKSIAFKLGIAVRTVEVHRSNLMRHLEANTFAELIRISVKAGIAGDGDDAVA